MTPTKQQSDCLEAFQTGKTLRINAYAGTGKTSTLTLLAQNTRKRGTCIMFNKAIAEEAKKKFPSTVSCSTTHSLAFRSIIKRGFGMDKMTGNLNGGFLAMKMGYRKRDYGDDLFISERSYGRLVLEAVQRFMRSGDADVRSAHVKFEGKIDKMIPPLRESLRRDVHRDAVRLWVEMIDPASKIAMTHDGYLKLWAMERPQIDGDFILLDEAQDTNGVVMELMRHQKAQLVTVGDRWQSIYRWRGAQNAMVELPTELEARLSTSFRFGPNIAGFATDILAVLGETLPLTGNPAVTDSLEIIASPRAILARTNGRLIEELMTQLEKNRKPFVVGGVSEMLTMLDATEKLQAGMTVDNPLMFFGYKNWSEVRAASQQEDGAELSRWVQLVEKYSVPTLKDAFEGLPKDEKKADVVLSTGHKSKGREWGEVRLCEDFLMGVSKKDDPEQGEKPIPTDELMLFYVAATRGQQKLDVHPDLTDRLTALKKRKAAGMKEAAE